MKKALNGRDKNIFKWGMLKINMKKRAVELGLIIVFGILVFGAVVQAANETSDSDKLDLAYKCLGNQVDNTKSSISLSEAVFGTLALGSKKKFDDEIVNGKKNVESCWPSAGCKIKESAQVLLAYNKIGKDTNGVKDWLLSKAIAAKELTWYLEIDAENHETSACTLKYDGKENKIQIKEDMTIGGTPGACLEISYGGYWLKIKDACLEKEFEISCEKSFVTTLVYQRKEGGAVFVSSETHSGAAGGATTEKVKSKCFATSSKCDYEGTLWATLALNKIKEDVSAYTPYLLALSEDNQKYLPSAFLFILTGGDDEYQELVEKQKAEGYWSIIGSPYNRFYDSALGMLALSGKTDADSTKNYLLKVQTKEGCWNNNNIQDTGFILYAWDGGRGGGGGGGGTTQTCIEGGNYCVPRMECLNAEGSVLDEFICGELIDSCCSINAVEKSCDEKGGIVCASNQECEGGALVSSADGACCVKGACIEKKTENLCNLANGVCSSSCSANEEELSESCPNINDVCCKAKVAVEEGGNYWTWIIIFGVLILLVIIGIAFRRNIQSWFYSRKKGGEREGPRGMPPRGPPMMMGRPRYGPPGMRAPARGGPAPRVTRGVKSPEDEEMEETMKKLRDMSK